MIFDLVEISREKAFEIFDFDRRKEEKFSTLCNVINNPFEFVSSTYKQQSLLEETGFYIPSRTICLGKERIRA